MIVNPFFRNSHMPLPDMKVYTLILETDEIGDIMCDAAWTVEGEEMTHWWNKDGRPIRRISMPFRDYLKRHFKMSGMNPFWDIGRLEYMERYEQAYPNWRKHGNTKTARRRGSASAAGTAQEQG